MNLKFNQLTENSDLDDLPTRFLGNHGRGIKWKRKNDAVLRADPEPVVRGDQGADLNGHVVGAFLSSKY